MILTKEQRDEFEKAARPLMEFLCKEFHPHVTVIVTGSDAELSEGSCRIQTFDYVRD